MFHSRLFLHNFIQSIDLKIEWHSLALFRATFCSYMDRGVELFISRRVAHIQIAFYTDVSAVLLSRRIYILSYYETCARSREEDREDIHGRRGGSRVLIKGVRASGGISLLAGRGVVAFRRECTGMNGRGGDRRLRDGGTRGESGGESGMHASNASALCARTQCSDALGSRRAPGIFTVRGCRVGGGTHVGICRRGRQRGTAWGKIIKLTRENWQSRRIRDADWYTRRVVSHRRVTTLRKGLTVAWVITRTLHLLWFPIFVIIILLLLSRRAKCYEYQYYSALREDTWDVVAAISNKLR